MIFCFIDESMDKNYAFKCILAPNVAVKVAVTKNLVAVEGPQVAMVLGWRLVGPGNLELYRKITVFFFIYQVGLNLF